MGFTVSDIIRIFSSKVPNKKPFAIYRISQKQALVHASSSGKYSAEPNTWIVDIHLLSTQGMEKSHYQARTSFFRSTRHGGGQIRSNVLKELFN